MPVTMGTESGDTIHGSESDDWIYGLGGDDVIYGHSGADWLEGGSGDDLLIGGDGNDTFNAGSGSDEVQGGTGYDLLVVDGYYADYSVTFDYLGVAHLQGPTGVVRLTSVEVIRFFDRDVSVFAFEIFGTDERRR